jgi:hypothetical protein
MRWLRRTGNNEGWNCTFYGTIQPATLAVGGGVKTTGDKKQTAKGESYL